MCTTTLAVKSFTDMHILELFIVSQKHNMYYEIHNTLRMSIVVSFKLYKNMSRLDLDLRQDKSDRSGWPVDVSGQGQDGDLTLIYYAR